MTFLKSHSFRSTIFLRFAVDLLKTENRQPPSASLRNEFDLSTAAEAVGPEEEKRKTHFADDSRTDEWDAGRACGVVEKGVTRVIGLER